MQDLTPEGLRVAQDAAQRHGVSLDAVVTLLQALSRGGGTQAQFSHPDLGGMGQWSQGGMTMVGDMFNQGLKYRVDNLCTELAGHLRSQPLFAATPTSSQPPMSQSQSQGSGEVSLFVPGSQSNNAWWPADLGTPASTGAQNDLRYAWFALPRRLAIKRGGRVQVYDTGEHMISGFSQQQGSDQSLTFTSQSGVVRVADLPLLGGDIDHRPGPGEPTHAAPRHAAPEPVAQRHATQHREAQGMSQPAAAPAPTGPAAQAPSPQAQAHASGSDVFTMLERLSELHQKGILTEAEFSAKKGELLSRL